MSLRLVTAKLCLIVALTAGAAACLCACANSTGGPPPNFATGGMPMQREYQLGPGDKLKVTVFGEDNLSGQFDVSPTGNVSMALVGEVKAQGLTVTEFRNAVTQKLVREGILRNPKVAVDVLNYRPIYVHGEVQHGGEFQYKSGLRLRDAIALAGGYTYRADQSYILLGRGDKQEAQVSLPGDALVLPGDNIRVPERFF